MSGINSGDTAYMLLCSELGSGALDLVEHGEKGYLELS